MNTITIYTQSLNHLGKRLFISQINTNNIITEDIKIFNTPEISEDDLSEINSLIKLIPPKSNIILYTLASYQNKHNKLKDKWIATDAGKELISLIKTYNITLKKYSKQHESFKNELIKKLTSFHKPLKNKKTPLPIQETSTCRLTQNKIYNFNDEICDVVNIHLRGSCDNASLEKAGFYVGLISKNSHELIIKGSSTNTTVGKMLLTGLIESIKVLKKPCLLKVYTHTKLGFSSGNTNLELKNKLFELIESNNHAIIEIISNEKQDYLDKLYHSK